jgi:hypothetical protein
MAHSNLSICLLHFVARHLSGSPSSGLRLSHLPGGTGLPVHHVHQKILCRPLGRNTDHEPLVFSERVESGEQVRKNAILVFHQPRSLKHL